MNKNNFGIIVLVVSAVPFAMAYAAADFSGNWQQFWVVLPWFAAIGAVIAVLVILTGASVWLLAKFQERRKREEG